MSNTSNNSPATATATRGSYRADYTQEECMKFTDKDQAVLDRLARDEAAATAALESLRNTRG